MIQLEAWEKDDFHDVERCLMPQVQTCSVYACSCVRTRWFKYDRD